MKVLMGLSPNESLKTEGKLSRISLMILVSTIGRAEGSTDNAMGDGKQLFIMPKPMRSCQESRTGWARFVVTRACVCTVFVLVLSTIFAEPSTVIFPPLALYKLLLLFLFTVMFSCVI